MAKYTDLEGALANPKDVTNLNLHHNDLTELSPEIGQLTNLPHLDLKSNKLESLPSEIGQLNNLTRLELGCSYFEYLDWADIFNKLTPMTNLTFLGLVGDVDDVRDLYIKIKSLPFEIRQLTNLRELSFLHPEDFDGTHFEETCELDYGQAALILSGLPNLQKVLPEKLGDLVKMVRQPESFTVTILDISNIDLTFLHSEIGLLPVLRKLDLSGNKLQVLPVQIGELTNLNMLDLSGNNLACLPASIGHLASLQILDLSRNDLDDKTIEFVQQELPNCQILVAKDEENSVSVDIQNLKTNAIKLV